MFFAGIGGFHSGLEKAGMECIGWCEFDKFTQKERICVRIFSVLSF
ncbi:MAG: DNA cytosine methyltransferase [Campylobacter sp.]